MTTSGTPDIFTEWLSALEARHLADLRVPELTRALRALSSAYVERRHKVAGGSTLDSAGKRAAFGLFYAPLHFLATQQVVRALNAANPAPSTIVDLGCGTGAAGAAWAIEAGSTPSVVGIDRHPWAVSEARWTYRQLRLHGQSRQGDLSRLPATKPGTAIVAAYVLNEMGETPRETLEHQLLEAATAGTRVLVLEPIARSITPWWDRTADRFRAAGGRADEWRFAIELPPLLRTFDSAAGLNHRELKLRTLFAGGA
jgi:methylase of polypeptide subunit release factors